MSALFLKFFQSPVVRVLFFGVFCSSLTHCSSRKAPTPSASAAYNALLTPPHNMTKSDYPFDDGGTYRRDWVNGKSNSRTSASSLPSEPKVNSYGARTPVSVPSTTSRSSTPPPPKVIKTPARTSPGVTTYHTVKSGDTLYAIGRRYNKSVPDLKRINGLSSNLIRLGQTLRIK